MEDFIRAFSNSAELKSQGEEFSVHSCVPRYTYIDWTGVINIPLIPVAQRTSSCKWAIATPCHDTHCVDAQTHIQTPKHDKQLVAPVHV